MKYSIICFFIFFLAAAYGLLHGSVIDIIRNYQEICDKETGVGFDNIAHTREHLEFSDDGKMDKFAVCMLKKLNIMKSDGSINIDINPTELLSDNPQILEKTAKCRAINEKDVYVLARKVINCYWKNDVLVMDPTPVRHVRPQI